MLYSLAAHFFFPTSDIKDKIEKSSSEEIDSFNDNPVLTALKNGHLPDVRPNYKYFGQLLLSDNSVVVRPKLTWIFVCSPDIQMDEHGNALTVDGTVLNPILFPHLKENLKLERTYDTQWDPRGSGEGPRKTILHEYARTIDQVTSTSTRYIVEKLEKFPQIAEKFNEITEQEEALNSNNLIHHCEIIHLETTLELPRTDARLPSNSELSGIIEVTISRPELQEHTWKCINMIQRPAEFCRTGEKTFMTTITEVAMQFTHQSECEATLDSTIQECDCTATQRDLEIRLPFPVNEWATILSRAAEYATVEGIVKDEDGRIRKTSEPAINDLFNQVCMVQELFSKGPVQSLVSNGNCINSEWTRRGILVWTFKHNVHLDKKGQLIRVPSGTHWNFMTLLDPMSQHHHQQVYISKEQAAICAAESSVVPDGSVSSSSTLKSVLPSPTAGYTSLLASDSHSDGSSTWSGSVARTPAMMPNLPHYAPCSSLPSSSHGSVTTTSSFTGLEFEQATNSSSASDMTYAGSFDSSLSVPASTSVYNDSRLSQQQNINSMPFFSDVTYPSMMNNSFQSIATPSSDILSEMVAYGEPGCNPTLSWEDATEVDSRSDIDSSFYNPSHSILNTLPQTQHNSHMPEGRVVETGSHPNFFIQQQAAMHISLALAHLENSGDQSQCQDGPQDTQHIWTALTTTKTPNKDFGACSFMPGGCSEWNMPNKAFGGAIEYDKSIEESSSNTCSHSHR